jgi:hypothetical protein
MVFIPSSRVSYARNYDQDLYCYGDNWYYVDDGGWYTSRFYDGPYVQIAFASVPYYVRSVPVSYRRHWGGTTQSYSYGYQRDRSWVDQTQSPDRNRTSGDRNQTWQQGQNRGNDGSWSDRNSNRDDRGQNQNRNQGRGRGNKGGNGNHRGWNRG